MRHAHEDPHRRARKPRQGHGSSEFGELGRAGATFWEEPYQWTTRPGDKLGGQRRSKHPKVLVAMLVANRERGSRKGCPGWYPTTAPLPNKAADGRWVTANDADDAVRVFDHDYRVVMLTVA